MGCKFGQIYRTNFVRAPCSECGKMIPWAVRPEIICAACRKPRNMMAGTDTGMPHWDDDPSGASGSWDAAVKRYEGS